MATPGPSRVSDSSVSAGTVNYEDFVVTGELGWVLSALLAWRGEGGEVLGPG